MIYPSEITPEYSFCTMKLLVIEDHEQLRSTLVAVLQEEGHAVDQSGDGEEGLYMAREWDYDAIILDVMLPKLEGWEVLTKLRETKLTPVLMLTARDTLDDRVKGLDGGADDYLTKPFEIDELLARLRALLRRGGGKHSPTVNVRGVEINTASREIKKDGELVDFSAREYALIELLALNPGHAQSRDTLYEKLFDSEHDAVSNLLDVYIHRVRSKLGKDFIQTKRGHGYLIEE